jgi:hypothetical protein
MMKKYLKVCAGIAILAMMITGCSPLAYSQNNGYYDQNSDYYNYGYGDGQPGGYYGQQQGNPNYQPVGFNDFYTQLSPYGHWVNIAPYGQVWVANVRGFQPYSTNGYWAYTTYGWTWVSNYPWGWAPFHYGRWGYNTRYGWYWVPGYTWGPAWVAWSSSADMYGWAPLMPGMSFGVTISLNLFPSRYWTFMPGRYMGRNNIGSYYVNRSRNTTIIKNTTIINNYGTDNNRRYSMGPNVSEVQRHTNTTIQPIRVSNAQDSRNTGISNNEMRVYRPVTANRTTTNVGNNNNNNRNNNREVTPPRPQSNQPATQQQTEYRRDPAQPEVKTATPEKTKQIRAARKDNSKTQQPSSQTTPSRRQ